jgi:hypothetical protein
VLPPECVLSMLSLVEASCLVASLAFSNGTVKVEEMYQRGNPYFHG